MPSRIMSRHHWYIVRSIHVRPMITRREELKWNHMIRPDVSRRADKAPVNGHGLGLTMW